MTDSAAMRPRRILTLTEDAKWGRPMRDEMHGLIRARIYCQVGGRDNPFLCGRGAVVQVGRFKLCKQHGAEVAAGRVVNPVRVMEMRRG